MSKLNQAILFINHLSLGLVIPVLNLILLDHGATLQTLPLLYMIMAAVVLCIELPSGICADLLGRKKTFLISCILNFTSFFLLLLINKSLTMLILIIILYGLGRAFASGSIDALVIDQALNRCGNDYLPKITSRLAVIEGIALSLGSIAGGMLVQVSNTFNLNLLCRSVSILFVMILCQLYIKEPEILKKENISLKQHIKRSTKVIQSNYKLGLVILGGLFAGIFLSSIETYWQPAFIKIDNNENNGWLLGIITFFGFLAVTLGNVISQKLLDKYKSGHMAVFLIGRGILACMLIVFALQKGSIGFVAVYTTMYLLLGISNISESTIINRYTPNQMRASVLSLYSLFLQIGLMCASLISSIAIKHLYFSGVWIIMACLMGGYILSISVVEVWIKKKEAGKIKELDNLV